MIDRIRYEEEEEDIYQSEETRPDLPLVYVAADMMDLLASGQINHVEYAILHNIGTLYNKKNNGCFASNAFIAKRSKAAPHTVSVAITKFRRLGLVKVLNPQGKNRRLIVYWHCFSLQKNKQINFNGFIVDEEKENNLSSTGHVEKETDLSPAGHLPVPRRTSNLSCAGHKNREENREDNKMNFRKPKIRVNASSSSKTKHKSLEKVQLTDSDKRQGLMLRSILEKSGNKLLSKLKRESYYHMISRLRYNLSVSEKEVEEMLLWLTKVYGQKFVPTIFKKDDLITKWDNFVAAKDRWNDKQTEDNEIDCRKVNYKEMDMMDPRMRAMSEKVGILRGWFKKNVEYWHVGNRAYPDDLKRACDELGFDVNTIDPSFI